VVGVVIDVVLGGALIFPLVWPSSGVALLSPNQDNSWHKDFASRQSPFHPNNIRVGAGILETGAGGLVRGQIGCA